MGRTINPHPMLAQSTLKNCQACNKTLKGRTDKKFCDDYCRNSFNNQLKSDSNNCIRNTNNALRKNRRILEALKHAGDLTTRVSQEKLLRLGFQFKYTTHLYTNKKGNTYHFCYEFGYLPLDNNWFLIVKQNGEE